MKRFLLRFLLTPTERTLVESLRRAKGYQPAEPLTAQECQRWGEILRSPLGLKIDATMINWLHERAQHAIATPSAETLAWAKFAYGCRAGWEMAKTLSTTVVAHDDTPETTAPTDGERLEQHRP